MSLQKIIILIIVTIFSMQNTNAWLGLTAQNGDLLNIGKWNDMITYLNTKINQSDVTGTGNIEVNNSGSGVVISLTGSVSASSIPYITSTNKYTYISTTSNININGLNFVPTTTVSIPSFGGTINSTTVNGPTDIDINITTNTNTGTYDFVITNDTVNNTLWTGNGVGHLSILPPSTWKDLRSGGDTFTHGNGAGNDIRYRTGMNMLRDSNGMHFTGSSPWSSWVKFESESWVRGTNKSVSWVFTRPTGTMMIGIGSTATNETNTQQYTQAEVEIYFNSTTSMWGLFGNNGTPGTTGNQSSSATLTCPSNTFKEVITNDGTRTTGIVNLYCLPSANPADWDNTSNLIKTLTIGGTLNPDEVNIMPFIIPRTGTQRFIALKVE